MERLYSRYVGSTLDSIIRHINKHNLDIPPEEYLAIGDFLTQGEQGKFSGIYNGKAYTAVVRGKVCEPDLDGRTRIIGILRSVRKGF